MLTISQEGAMRTGGQWSRWGRRSCEGWSLEIGNAFRGAVVQQQQARSEPVVWRASINAQELGPYPDRETAVKRVEELIESEMRAALEDWGIYIAAKRGGS